MQVVGTSPVNFAAYGADPSPCTMMGSPRCLKLSSTAAVHQSAGVAVPNDQHCVYQRSSMLRLVMSTMMGSRVAADA